VPSKPHDDQLSIIFALSASPKPHDDQLSIILALSASPNQRYLSSIKSLHHLDAHIDKCKYIFLL
jgi:hypothetical protein